MTVAHRAIVASALALGACAARQPRRSTPGAPSAAAARLAPLLEANCSACHDGDADRPTLGARDLPDADLAMKAALLISAGRMPPPPSALTPGDRTALLDALCERGARSVARCKLTYAPAMDTALVREPLELLAAIDKLAPGPRGQLEIQYRAVFNFAGRTYHLDDTFMTFATLLALERCARQPDHTASAQRRCVASILDLDLLRVPRPEALSGHD